LHRQERGPYAAGEASVRAADQAVQSLGGHGVTKEYGIRGGRALRGRPPMSKTTLL
jgi:alkylation response protein AidB-like acyl-CoA dehydrogenase